MNPDEPLMTIFDSKTGLLNTGGDSELLKILIQTAAEEIPDLLVELTAALAANENQVAQRLAHTIKGDARTLGGKMTEKVAAEMEQLIGDDAIQQAIELLPELQHQLDLMFAEMDSFEGST